MISLDELRAALEIESPLEEDILEKLEVAAVAFVEREADWHFVEVANLAETVVGEGSDRLPLRGLVTVKPATVSESAYVGATPVTITATNADGYELRSKGTPTNRVYLLRKHGYIWHEGYEYTVTATRGYTAGQEPVEIRELVRDLVLLKWAERDASGGLFRSETIGPYTYTLSDLSRLPNYGTMPPRDLLRYWAGWVVA